jgi:hypothetical protein
VYGTPALVGTLHHLLMTGRAGAPRQLDRVERLVHALTNPT